MYHIKVLTTPTLPCACLVANQHNLPNDMMPYYGIAVQHNMLKLIDLATVLLCRLLQTAQH